MNDLKQLHKILQTTATDLCHDIADAQGLDLDAFVISVDSTLVEPYVVGIDAGYPPILRIDTAYIGQSLFIDSPRERKAYINAVKRKLSLAISKIPRQQKTLALVPLGQAIALRQDSRKFVRTLFPEKIHFTIPESHLQISTVITVTAREVTTGMTVILSGANESYLRTKALAQLTSLVQDSEIFLDTVEQETFIPEEAPAKILITSSPDEDNVKYEYD
jgi:hypothetical protein